MLNKKIKAMTLVKYNPSKRSYFPGFTSLFDDFFNDELYSNRMVGTMPSVNVRETEDTFFVELAAPGMSKNDFKVEADNNQLTISSEKESNNEEKDENGKYTMREFNYQSFRRSFTLPDSANADKIAASYKDGVLNISIPKKEEAKQKPIRTIKIG
ncbi:MAG: Hsp20/alpha crystallin family protein [Cytophagales bacterium]